MQENTGLQVHDSAVCAAEGLCKTEGASSPDIRLSQDSCEGNSGENPEGMLVDAGDTNACDGGVDARDHVLTRDGPFDSLTRTEPVRFEFASGDASHAECVREIMVFVRGDRVGLDRLKRVLPNIFKAFPGCLPSHVLKDCGLLSRPDDGEYPTFFFRPERDGRMMIEPGHGGTKPVRSGREEAFSSEDLADLYGTVSAEWSSRNRSNS
jgi:hypothetical protein